VGSQTREKGWSLKLARDIRKPKATSQFHARQRISTNADSSVIADSMHAYLFADKGYRKHYHWIAGG
jgi:hypothetical protein